MEVFLLNRNVESHFSQLPAADIQRSTFNIPYSHKTSFNVGELIPFYVSEVLPGDTFDLNSTFVVRSQTLLTPVMDNIFLDKYFFFVPNRLVWQHWKEFCGENTSGAWAPKTEYTVPCIIPPEGGFQMNTIADYMGLPIGVEWKAEDDLAPIALPFRAYALICNEFFRDENLTDPLLIPLDDANQQGTNGDNYISDVANGGKPFKAAKIHDYFTSALPSPQKGEAVGIPINVPGFAGGQFPVTTSNIIVGPGKQYPVWWSSSSDEVRDYNWQARPRVDFSEDADLLSARDTETSHRVGDFVLPDAEGSGFSYHHVYPVNLKVDIPPAENAESSEVSFSVNELRLAFAYQRFLESLARNGSRYTELLLGLFGVRSPDASLQRPEYLGGNRVPISISEVTNNAQTEKDFLGDVGAKSGTFDAHRDCIKSFTEHGYVIGVMVARYTHSYAQGLNRFWMRKKFTDYYNPKFAHLGEVPVYQAEIYANGNFSKEKVFGYQEIWAEYRYKPSMVTSEMRPNVENSLAFWHLADNYGEVPTLSDGWIREDLTNVDRVLAVTSKVSNQFWADIFVLNRCTRPMPMYSVPGLLDHF